jgi:hypothetical protein
MAPETIASSRAVVSRSSIVVYMLCCVYVLLAWTASRTRYPQMQLCKLHVVGLCVWLHSSCKTGSACNWTERWHCWLLICQLKQSCRSLGSCAAGVGVPLVPARASQCWWPVAKLVYDETSWTTEVGTMILRTQHCQHTCKPSA